MQTLKRKRSWSVVLVAIASGMLLSCAWGESVRMNRKVSLDLPPRYQWAANFGYCGEITLITAGLYYGQYTSQFVARNIASPLVPQYEEESQLLLGVNDVAAANAMRLTAVPWDTDAQSTKRGFLIFVKSHLAMGHPVMIGVFTNERRLFGDTDPDAGLDEYDHIVLAVRLRSRRTIDPGNVRYFPRDLLTFTDNGLFEPGDVPRYYFRYRFDRLFRNRRKANLARAPIYSLNDNLRNYGLAITGVADLEGDTVPVRLETDTNEELPTIEQGANTAPAPMPVQLTAVVSLPDTTTNYVLYRYDSFDAVPDSNFNANAANAVESWLIPAGTGANFVVNKSILSNQTVIFRAVRASAP